METSSINLTITTPPPEIVDLNGRKYQKTGELLIGLHSISPRDLGISTGGDYDQRRFERERQDIFRFVSEYFKNGKITQLNFVVNEIEVLGENLEFNPQYRFLQEGEMSRIMLFDKKIRVLGQNLRLTEDFNCLDSGQILIAEFYPESQTISVLGENLVLKPQFLFSNSVLSAARWQPATGILSVSNDSLPLPAELDLSTSPARTLDKRDDKILIDFGRKRGLVSSRFPQLEVRKSFVRGRTNVPFDPADLEVESSQNQIQQQVALLLAGGSKKAFWPKLKNPKFVVEKRDDRELSGKKYLVFSASGRGEILVQTGATEIFETESEISESDLQSLICQVLDRGQVSRVDVFGDENLGIVISGENLFLAKEINGNLPKSPIQKIIMRQDELEIFFQNFAPPATSPESKISFLQRAILQKNGWAQFFGTNLAPGFSENYLDPAQSYQKIWWHRNGTCGVFPADLSREQSFDFPEISLSKNLAGLISGKISAVFGNKRGGISLFSAAADLQILFDRPSAKYFLSKSAVQISRPRPPKPKPKPAKIPKHKPQRSALGRVVSHH